MFPNPLLIMKVVVLAFGYGKEMNTDNEIADNTTRAVETWLTVIFWHISESL